jgi:hypothetical protein
MTGIRSRLWRQAAGAALLGLLAACGGSGGDGATPAGREQALALSRPGELVSFVQAKLRARQSQLAANPGMVFGGTMPATDVAFSPSASTSLPARSGSTVQEDGVDEADLLQSDGLHLYALQPGNNALSLQPYARVADGSIKPLATLKLPADAAELGLSSDGMHLSSDARSLAVLSQAWERASGSLACPLPGCIDLYLQFWLHSSVAVQRVDISDPAAASAGERLRIDGHLVDSRRIGDALYLVSSHTPRLAVEALPATASAAEREAAIASLSAADLLPRMRRNGGAAEPLLSETDCYLQAANASLAVEITTITVFDLKSPTLAHSSRCFVGGAEALYMTTGSLYLATTRWAYRGLLAALVYPGEIQTDIHKFALAGGTVEYRGSGQVRGHLGWDPQKKSFRLSEYQGDLRVLSYTGMTGWATVQDATATAASPALLTVLRERASDQTLQPVATLPNATRSAPLGKPGEQVYGVRFVGPRGYVVTFRRIDPLYVLDLSNSADPRTTGQIELAGFSESLFPLNDSLLLGVGRDADEQGRVTGLKLALFDVKDATLPRLLGSQTVGGAGSFSALDSSRHGLNLFNRKGVMRIALPVLLVNAASGSAQQGLKRFEVDTAAPGLKSLPMLGGRSTTDDSTWLERSLQIEDQVYYLSSAGLTAYPW